MTQVTHPNQAEAEKPDPRFDYESRLKFKSEGWLASNIDEAADSPDRTTSFVMLSKLKASRVVINCYEPGQADEMHCHPGSEHTFLVWKGTLHVRGIAPGEELTLGPGDFVQIKAGYYYQLHNPGPELAVYCQFGTVPAKPPKKTMVFYSESRRGKQAAAG